MSIDTTSLHAILTQIAEVSAEFKSVLQQEQTILRNQDLPALEALPPQKSQLLTQLTEQEKQLLNALNVASIDDIPNAIQPLLSQQAGLATLWQQCQSQLREVQQLNKINGSAIASLLEQNHRKGAILFGDQSNTSTYTETGGID